MLNKNENDTIGSRLRTLRNDQGVSQKVFARRIGYQQNTISALERGTLKMNDRTIDHICSRYGVNETWLRTGEGRPYIENPDIEKGEDSELKFKVTDEMIENFPELRHLLLFAEENDRDGFEDYVDTLSRRREKQSKKEDRGRTLKTGNGGRR